MFLEAVGLGKTCYSQEHPKRLPVSSGWECYYILLFLSQQDTVAVFKSLPGIGDVNLLNLMK